MKQKTILNLFLASSIALAACGGSSSDAGSEESVPTTEEATGDEGVADNAGETTGTAQEAGSDEVEPEETDASSPDDTAPTGEVSEQGTPYDIGPPAGERMRVVGVRYDDVLNFRDSADPDAQGEVVSTAAPLDNGPVIVSSGEGLLFDEGSAWWRVTIDGQAAWANTRFLKTITDSQGDIFPELDAEMNSLTTLDLPALVDAVRQARSAGASTSVTMVSDEVGIDAQGAQVTIDVIGFEDDSVAGERIVLTYNYVFEDINAEDLQIVGVELVAAEMSVICSRGLASPSSCR